MAWAVPKFPKKRVNLAGELLISTPPETRYDEHGDRTEQYDLWLAEYFEGLDIVNNWRSAHNFPLNTFHIGLKRRAQQIDPKAITAQRIKRLASIELKLGRFPT